MGSLREGWRIQVRVIAALMIRELTTRFGRENIGFLWVMVEPLMFGGFVALMWVAMKGPQEHGISVVAFVISGYLPLTLFRHAISKSISIFTVNSALMYHRQIKIVDFIFVRFLIEYIGVMMAYLFVGIALYFFGLFPMPWSIGYMLWGWFLYGLFTLSVCFVLAPLSEMSEILEKIIPVTTYLIIPFSGTFNMTSWLPPEVRDVMLWSPPVTAMELMRYGLFGDKVTPYYDEKVPLVFAMVCTVIGLALCRKVRRTLVVE